MGFGYNLLRVDPKYTVDAVWDYFSNAAPTGLYYLSEMTRYAKVFAAHGMGVTGLSAVPSWQQGNAVPTFSWDVPSIMFGPLFDKYYVELYDTQGNLILQSSPILISNPANPTASWTPSSLQWATIRLNSNVVADQKVAWVVRCSNDWSGIVTHAAVTTGLYWSDDYCWIYLY